MHMYTLILLILVLVANAPPKGVLAVSTDASRKSLILSAHTMKEKQ
jgi:hypothetical protein